MTRLDYHMKNVAANSGMNFPKKEKKDPVIVSDTEDEKPDAFNRFMITNNSFMLGIGNLTNRASLVEDIDTVVKKAKNKAGDRWVMVY